MGIAMFLGALVIALGVYYLAVVQPQLREYERVRTLSVFAIDLSTVPDGSHRGSFSYANFTYVVEVTVKNHQIADVQILRNRDTKYAIMAEDVVVRVLQAQSLQVDSITGATTTSKALLKAMEDALRKCALE